MNMLNVNMKSLKCATEEAREAENSGNGIITF